jgi:hypothetical protein
VTSGFALYLASILIALIGGAHSYLGERYILVRLFRRPDLPHLFGSADFTIRTLRFAWHLTTLAWLGLAGVLLVLAGASVSRSTIAAVVAATFLLHFAVALVGSRGRHWSWLVFLAIALLVFYAAFA